MEDIFPSDEMIGDGKYSNVQLQKCNSIFWRFKMKLMQEFLKEGLKDFKRNWVYQNKKTVPNIKRV